MIVIIDYGMGNVGSVQNMLKKTGAQALISSDRAEIASADKLILPGVGAFDEGMRLLAKLDLIGLLNQRVLVDRVPVLGICLGMQLLTRGSEEGSLAGLGWVAADTIRFRAPESEPKLKVPHMGWNSVEMKNSAKLFPEGEAKPRFYFVHSYHVVCDQERDVAGQTTYGIPFTSSVQRDNIYGTQFHPEKSHRYGMDVLARFAKAA